VVEWWSGGVVEFGVAGAHFLHFFLAKLSHAKNATLAKNSGVGSVGLSAEVVDMRRLATRGLVSAGPTFVNREAVCCKKYLRAAKAATVR
jgi:hypothetical protein